MPRPVETDYLVIGSGIAGLYFAHLASEHGNVVIVTKRRLNDTATQWAQGGIAAVFDPNDSYEQHVADTLTVGDGLCDLETVELVVRQAPQHIERLAQLGASFARDSEGQFDLGREGGHSERRIVHYADATGREVQRALMDAIAKNPRITVKDHHTAVDLLSSERYTGTAGCFGAFVLDLHNQEVTPITARATILATGGAGKVYVYTSNPDVATGDGIAMAYRLGAAVSDLEFVQFHPTVLHHPHAKSFLITEAMRGEGGILRLSGGESFMEGYHKLASLAPRDVVARAIDHELKISGDDSVFLDVTHLDASFVRERFPTIAQRCGQLGIDIAEQPIPVVPAAHYLCGGIVTDKSARTTIANLYAIGESASTGMHGACRLASNSLLESLVFADRAAAAVREADAKAPEQSVEWSIGVATDSDDAIVVSLNWDEIRRFMWSYLGIVRSDKRIERARRRIELLRDEIREYYWNFKVTRDLIELRNLALTAHLIIDSAARRKESRGLHYTLDYPHRNPNTVHTELRKSDPGAPQ